MGFRSTYASGAGRSEEARQGGVSLPRPSTHDRLLPRALPVGPRKQDARHLRAAFSSSRDLRGARHALSRVDVAGHWMTRAILIIQIVFQAALRASRALFASLLDRRHRRPSLCGAATPTCFRLCCGRHWTRTRSSPSVRTHARREAAGEYARTARSGGFPPAPALCSRPEVGSKAHKGRLRLARWECSFGQV